MTISLLKTLVAIAEQGSFGAAADSVNVSHAAVGQQMKRLEAVLQVSLFDRTKRSPELNQLAKALVPKAQKLIYSYDTLLDDLVGEAQLFGELTLGAVPSSIRELVPLSIKELVYSYPALHVRVVPGLSGALYTQVERGVLDAAILTQPPRVAANLTWRPFVEEELILLTPAEINGNDPVRLLKEMPYIGLERQAVMGELIQEWLLRNNISIRTAMEMESLESVTNMVSHNLGISIVPNSCVPDPIFKKLRKIRLPSTPGFRVLGLLARSDCSKGRLIDKLLEQVERIIAREQTSGG